MKHDGIRLNTFLKVTVDVTRKGKSKKGFSLLPAIQTHLLFFFLLFIMEIFEHLHTREYNKSSYPSHSFNNNQHCVYIGPTYVMENRASEFTLKVVQKECVNKCFSTRSIFFGKTER